MTEAQRLTIGDLAEAAGVTPRTIRYYTAEGLLPPPDTRGRYAVYGEEHLLRLRLIARLKDAYLPLGEIKARMTHLNGVQIAQLLAEYEQAPAPAGSAADYLAQVLASSLTPPAVAQPIRRQPSEAKSLDTRMLAEARQDYTAAEAHGEDPAAARSPALPLGFAAPAPQLAHAPGRPKRLVSEQRVAQRGMLAAPEETWQRLALAPGVELHVREPLSRELRERVTRLIEQARDLFDT
jgi:DNA-binding transcriptional MerR regulator